MLFALQVLSLSLGILPFTYKGINKITNSVIRMLKLEIQIVNYAMQIAKVTMWILKWGA